MSKEMGRTRNLDAQREHEATLMLQDHVEGMTYADISDKYDCAISTVHKRIVAANAKVLDRNVDYYRAEQDTLIDALFNTYLEPALRGDIRSADYVEKLMERRGKLHNLYAPDTNVSINIENNGPRTQSLQIRLAQLKQIEDARVAELVEGEVVEDEE